jgi:hypothetical protein
MWRRRSAEAATAQNVGQPARRKVLRDSAMREPWPADFYNWAVKRMTRIKIIYDGSIYRAVIGRPVNCFSSTNHSRVYRDLKIGSAPCFVEVIPSSL